MLYHQNSLAQVKRGISRRRVSQSFSPRTRWLLCFQNRTSASSRSYQPLATIPCPAGVLPVTIDDWAVQVSAGNAGAWLCSPCLAANAVSPGRLGPSSERDSPTTLMTATRMARAVWHSRCAMGSTSRPARKWQGRTSEHARELNEKHHACHADMTSAKHLHPTQESSGISNSSPPTALPPAGCFSSAWRWSSGPHRREPG